MQQTKEKQLEALVQMLNSRRTANGYMPIEDYGLIGNMRTCAMIATDGGLDYMCWPYFDSPSVFCRILDQTKGGHYHISPTSNELCTTKQHYLPASNILQTRYLKDEGVLNVIDFFPRPNNKGRDAEYHANVIASDHTGNVPERPDLKKWLVRRVECIRGSMDVNVEVLPAFNYAQDAHTTEIDDSGTTERGHHLQRVTFRSKNLALELNATIDCGNEPDKTCPAVMFTKSDTSHSLGSGVTATFRLGEGQAVSFILRDAEDHSPEIIDTTLINELQRSTHEYWARWIDAGRYTGRWAEVVTRSLLLLKMLTFEPSGAIIASPTFSLPEYIGGVYSLVSLWTFDSLHQQVREIGITVTRGYEMLPSLSTFCYVWDFITRPKPISATFSRGSRRRRNIVVHCLSCLLYGAVLTYPSLSFPIWRATEGASQFV